MVYVYDGAETGKDVDYQSDTYALGMNYGLKGGLGDIVSVKWGISSAKKCTLNEKEVDVTGMLSMGDSPSIQTSGLNLKVILQITEVVSFFFVILYNRK